MRVLARWCVRHGKLVLAIWLVALIGFAVADGAAGSNFSTKFQLPTTPSARALSLRPRPAPRIRSSSTPGRERCAAPE